MSKRAIAVIAVTLLGLVALSGGGRCTSVGFPFPEGAADVAVSEDSIFIVWNRDFPPQFSGRVEALEAGTGKERWKAVLPKQYLVTPLTVFGDLLMVPTWNGGVFVLDAGSGAVKAQLMPGNYGSDWSIASSPTALIIGVGGRGANFNLQAYDRESFRPEWKRTIKWAELWGVTTRNSAFDVLTSDPVGMGGVGHRFRTVTLSASDGRTLSIEPAQAPEGRTGIPASLSKPVRAWLRELLRAKKPVNVTFSGSESKAERRRFIAQVQRNTFIARTDIVRLGDLLIVGNKYDDHLSPAPARVYAVRADTANVIWKMDAPGLRDIRLQGETLYVIRNREKGLIVTALEARSGRVLWKRGVQINTAHS